MKSIMSRFFLLLVCVSLLCAAMCAVALADDTCTHDYAKIERPTKKTYPATCIEDGGYIYEVVCSKCGELLNEYKQADPKTYPQNPNGHQYQEVMVKGECVSGSVTQKICTLCGHTEQDTNGGNHDWQKKSHKATTCDDTSYTYEECSKCHMTRNYESEVTVTTHTYTKNKVQVNIEPTCGKNGEGTKTCDCGQQTLHMPIKPTGEHKYAPAVTVLGSCKDGTKTVTSQTCTVCGDKVILETTNPKHDYVATNVVEATCQQEGRRESKCTICGKIEWSQPLSKTGHTAGEWQTKGDRHWRNCTICGKEMNAGSHVLNKQNPLCTDRVYCTVCFTVMREAGRHSGSVVQDGGDDTYHDLKCQNCSYVSGRAKHTYAYVDSDCTKGKVCTVCGHRASGNASHTLSSNWTGVVNGHARKCTVSGCSYMVVEAHTWGEWYVAQAPTNTAIGTEAARCTKCSAVLTRAIPKLTATPTPRVTPAPTDTPVVTETVDRPTNMPETSAPTNRVTSAPETSAPANRVTTAPEIPAPTNQATNVPATSAPTDQTTGVPGNAASVTEPTKAPADSAPKEQETKTPEAAGATSLPTDEFATNAPTNASTSQPTAGDATDVTTELPALETEAPAETSTPEQGMEDADSTEEDADAAEDETDEADGVSDDDMSTVTIAASDEEVPLCGEADRACVWKEFLQGGLIIRVCGICGDVVAVPVSSDSQTAMAPVFQLVKGVTVTGMIPENCGLTLRAASLAAQDGAYAAISAVWMTDGAAAQLADAVQVSVPLLIGETDEEGVVTVPTDAFKLVRVDVADAEIYLEEQTEIEFTYEDGILTFEMEQDGMYLLIPA